MAETNGEGTVLNARFRIRLPEYTWISDISREFPNAKFRLLTGLRTETGGIELGEVLADEPSIISEAIRTHPSIVDHQVLDSTDTRSLSRYETTDSDLYDFVERSSVAPEFPITVQYGWFEYDLTATQNEFEHFRSGLEQSERPFELVSVVRHVDTAGLLTDRQREVLETALREGYFKVPRECTLEDLATSLDADKSTVSEVLRRGDAKILKWYLTGPASR